MDADQLTIERQQQQLVKEIGQLSIKKADLTDDQSSIKYAKYLAKKLSINYGSGLCLVFWLKELLEIYPENQIDVNFSKNKQQRITHIGRLIKLGGGTKALTFCISQLPEYGAKHFNSLLDSTDSWKQKKSCNFDAD